MDDEIYPGLLPVVVLGLGLGMLASLAIIVPLMGVLVRFQANYNPKALQLDSEGGAPAHTGPVVNGYFQMFRRVYRIEGIAGLYKGFMPTAITAIAFYIVILLTVGIDQLLLGKYKAPETGVVETLVTSVAMVVISLPINVLTNRAITTPHKLGSFDLRGSLRTLLTPTERSRPWVLYLTPGLMAANFSRMAVMVLILGPLRRLLLPKMSQLVASPSDIPMWKPAIYLAFLFAEIVILTPLEIIATKLSIQRNHSSAEYNAVAQEGNGGGDPTVEYAGAEEDVMGLRNEWDPYLGLADCAKRIVKEEGWTTLYRAWWVTLLGGLGGLGSAFA